MTCFILGMVAALSAVGAGGGAYWLWRKHFRIPREVREAAKRYRRE